ncbi:hypothetical protein BH24BAC1_BH24BAC1_04010 [soil metagenome]
MGCTVLGQEAQTFRKAMKKISIPFNLFLACLLVLQIGCAPRTSSTVPINDTGNTTAMPEGVRAPITANYEDYAGRYRVDQANLGDATITVENARLYGQLGNRPRTELLPGPDRNLFNAQGMEGVQVRFNRNEQNRVTGLEISTKQGSVRGVKVD